MLTLSELPSCRRLGIALSGGVDSVALLHVCKKLQLASQLQVPLFAIHINHQISPHANAWQHHVEQLCKDLSIPLFVRRVSISLDGEGLEQAARRARYAVFNELLGEGDLLAFGHHQNDQAETLLLRLLRGAGVQGLGAMPAMRPLGKGALWRPFLAYNRAQIMVYAQQHNLQWVEDESNTNVHYSRNFVRAKVLPVLNEHWPQAISKLNQAAEHAAEAQQLLTEYAAADFAKTDCRHEKIGQSIDLTGITQLSWPRQKQLIGYWLTQLQHLPLSAAQWLQLQGLVQAKSDASPLLQVSDFAFRRYAGRLYLLPAFEAIKQDTQTFKGACFLSDGSQLTVVGISCELEVRFRPSALRAHPEGRAHSQTLKKLLQEYQVPPWLRPQVPLVYAMGQLVAVGDYWLEHSARTLHPNVQVSWSYPSASKTYRP